MNVLLISSSYIENSIKENFDIFINRSIEKLYLFKENHIDSYKDGCNISENINYEIQYIDEIEDIKELFEVYIIYDAILNKKYLCGWIEHFKKLNLVIKLMASKAQLSEIEKYIPLNSFDKIYNADFLSNIKDSNIICKIQDKPVIFIAGLSRFNQQMKVELQLKKMLNQNNISCFMVSKYLINAEYLISEAFLESSEPLLCKWSNLAREIQNNHDYSKSDVVIVSLPFDIGDVDILQYTNIFSALKVFCPNYTICCMPNDKDLLDKIDSIVQLFESRYSSCLNTVCISEYGNNKYEMLNMDIPIKKSYKDFNNKALCLIVKSSEINYLYNDIIKTITYPDTIKLIN